MKSEDIAYLKIVLFYLLMVFSMIGVHLSSEAFLGMNYFNFPWELGGAVIIFMTILRMIIGNKISKISDLWMEYPEFSKLEVLFFIGKMAFSIGLVYNVATFVKFNFISAPATVLMFFGLSIVLPELIYAAFSNLKLRKGLQ